MKNQNSDKTPKYTAEIASGTPREIPETMNTKKAFAYNQNRLAIERTEFSKVRTDLAFTNSRPVSSLPNQRMPYIVWMTTI